MTSPLRPPTPPAVQMKQYYWRIYDRKEVCVYIRTLEPSKTSKEEEKLKGKELKEFVIKDLHQNREKTITSLLSSRSKAERGNQQISVMSEYSDSERKPVDHISLKTDNIYTLKLSKARKNKREGDFKCLGSTNCDVMVSDVTVTEANGDVTMQDVNKPIARKRYAQKHSLVSKKGFIRSSVRVCSQTFTKVACILAIVISILGGLLYKTARTEKPHWQLI